MAEIDVQPTPNPNSLKITMGAERFIESGLESFGSAEEAAGHPLGSELFAVPGVANVFIVPQFLTISKLPDAQWEQILPAVKDVLRRNFES